MIMTKEHDEGIADGLVHDEVEIEDFEYDKSTDSFTYPCPCGDEFTVSRVSTRRYLYNLKKLVLSY